MELEKFKVTELTLHEQQNLNGGVLKELLLLVAGIILEDWDNFKAGLQGKPEIPR